MLAAQLTAVGKPLDLTDAPTPEPTSAQRLLKVEACAVCRTDLHLLDGEVTTNSLPRTLGHQIVGTDEDGGRFGVPWLGSTCGECEFCTSGRENLCPKAQFTGCDIDGGFAEYAVADRRFTLALPSDQPAEHLAPLLCAGLIGYRSLRKAGPPETAKALGIYGFGAAANVIAQVAIHQGRRVFAFTRAADTVAQRAAIDLGATWAGSSAEPSPEPLDAAIIFAPAGELVPKALKDLKPGGTLVTGGIHMSDIPSFAYDDLWRERTITSVANLTRQDGDEFLSLAPSIPVKTQTTAYPLEQVNQALDDLRHGRFTGSAVIVF